MNKLNQIARWMCPLAAVLLVTMPALAGPLDRQDIEPRRNPAADSMIRIPGVIGMDYQSAMQALQQAGLNPILKTEKTPNPRYEGREGTVIQQLPRPGGMAMHGSSVTITYYQPAQTPQTGQPASGPPSAPESQAGGGPPAEQQPLPPAQQPPLSSQPATPVQPPLRSDMPQPAVPDVPLWGRTPTVGGRPTDTMPQEPGTSGGGQTVTPPQSPPPPLGRSASPPPSGAPGLTPAQQQALDDCMKQKLGPATQGGSGIGGIVARTNEFSAARVACLQELGLSGAAPGPAGGAPPAAGIGASQGGGQTVTPPPLPPPPLGRSAPPPPSGAPGLTPGQQQALDDCVKQKLGPATQGGSGIGGIMARTNEFSAARLACLQELGLSGATPGPAGGAPPAAGIGGSQGGGQTVTPPPLPPPPGRSAPPPPSGAPGLTPAQQQVLDDCVKKKLASSVGGWGPAAAMQRNNATMACRQELGLSGAAPGSTGGAPPAAGVGGSQGGGQTAAGPGSSGSGITPPSGGGSSGGATQGGHQVSSSRTYGVCAGTSGGEQICIVRTGLQVRAGSRVDLVAMGKIDFGGGVPIVPFGPKVGAPVLDADGDHWQTPSDYPAPALRKNSLIAHVGSKYYQGGTQRSFTPDEDGELVLMPNDKYLGDNKGVLDPGSNVYGWQVTVTVTPRQ